ncbi:MAG: hypothetical protein WA268_15445 [Xanthobacteraceae bacterium]
MTMDPLYRERMRVETAERQLSQARADMSKRADELKISHHGLFSESKFVLRTSSESWQNDARKDGRNQGRKEAREEAHEELLNLLPTLLNPGNGPFAHLGRTQQQDRAAFRAGAILRAVGTAERGGHEPPEPTGLAKAIVDAGRKARGEAKNDQ